MSSARDDILSRLASATVGPAGAGTSGGWIEAGFNVGDFVDLTSTIRVKFVASDLGDGSVVEAGIDDVRIIGVSCNPDTCLADINMDGELNFLDVSAFLALFADGELAADLTNDGQLNFLDVSAYLNEFANCP